MQFIEKSGLYLRAAVHRFGRVEGGPQYILFPMIHIGSPQFYSEVSDRLSDCDVIFFEGVKSNRMHAVTLAYRMLAQSKKLGLVTQSSMDLSHVRNRLVHADIDEATFDAGWKGLPIRDKLLIGVAMPFLAVYLAFTTSREFIANSAATDDFSSGAAFLGDDPSDNRLNHLIVSQRDQRLVGTIDLHHRENRDKPMVVGVLYGAGHMRAVTRLLMSKLGYRVTGSEWIKICDLP